MALPERLHAILVKLRDSFDEDLPDPASLQNSGQVQSRGQTYTALSSAPLADLANQDAFTLYLHTQGDEDTERLKYVHFENRGDLTSIMIKLDMVDGSLRQNITLSSLPREIFMQRVDQMTGKGGRPPRREMGGRGARPGDRGRRDNMPPPPPMMEESDDSME